MHIQERNENIKKRALHNKNVYEEECMYTIQQAEHEKAKYAKAPAGDIQTKFLLKVDPQLSEKEGKKLVHSCEYENNNKRNCL